MKNQLISLVVGIAGGVSLAFGEVGSHVVAPDETLWGIARANGVSVADLKDWNGLASDIIEHGQVLELAGNLDGSSQTIEVETADSEDEVTPSADQSTDVLRLQVLLDRAGFGPGKIDGLDGRFTRQALEFCKKWNAVALESDVATTQLFKLPPGFETYIDEGLPGSGKRPDFRALTRTKKVLAYYSVGEYLAERFHCSEALLARLNPKVDFSSLSAGDTLIVPNVIPFEIEQYLNKEGEGIWSRLVGKGREGRMIRVSKEDLFITLWEGDRMLRAFPITLNPKETPTGSRTAAVIVPGPRYSRKKTALDLLPGPNSPVGVMWLPLGNGYGIHGTNDPDSIGRAVSSGCIRLANWDAVRLAGMVRRGVQVEIGNSENSRLVSR